MASTLQKRPGANARRANAEVQRFLATLASPLYQEEGLRFSAQIGITYDSSNFIKWSSELAEGHGGHTIQKIEWSGSSHKEFSRMLRAVGSSPSLTSATFKGESSTHGSNMRDEWPQIFIELKASRTLQELKITPHDLGKEGVQAIGDFLCACASVRKFSLDCRMDSGVIDMVVEAVLASNHTLEELCLTNFRRQSSLLEALTPDSSGLQSNTSLRHLKLVQWHCFDHVTMLANILQRNSSLTKFSMISTRRLNPAHWIALLDSLKQNMSIRFLDFSHCGGMVGTAVLDAIIEILEANPRLENIELEGTAPKDNGSAAKVESHLARKVMNIKNESRGSSRKNM